MPNTKADVLIGRCRTFSQYAIKGEGSKLFQEPKSAELINGVMGTFHYRNKRPPHRLLGT